MKATIEIQDSFIHDTIKSAIAKEIRDLDIKEIVRKTVETKLEYIVRQNITDGSFAISVAKKIASEISMSEILDIVDVNQLNTIVSERVIKFMLTKMSLLEK